MKLKIDSMYKTATGFIIPRSHFSIEKGQKWLCVDVLTITQGGRHYTKTSTTMTQKEIKQALGLERNEGVTIV